jgi:hypothetical protein
MHDAAETAMVEHEVVKVPIVNPDKDKKSIVRTTYFINRLITTTPFLPVVEGYRLRIHITLSSNFRQAEALQALAAIPDAARHNIETFIINTSGQHINLNPFLASVALSKQQSVEVGVYDAHIDDGVLTSLPGNFRCSLRFRPRRYQQRRHSHRFRP